MFDGTFDGDWRPANVEDTTTVNLMSWEMSINGKLEIACISSVPALFSPIVADIDVTRK